MIPEYELKHHSRDHKLSAYDKVREWLPEVLEDALPVLDTLSWAIPYDSFHRNDREKKEISPVMVEQKTLELYGHVLMAIEEDPFKLSHYNFSNETKQEIVDSLHRAGFNVSEEDFWDIIQVAKAVRDGVSPQKIEFTSHNFQFRYASLNCYDFERFIEEMKDLGECVGFRSVELICPRLVRIYLEAISEDNERYPGRHLPFDRIKGRSAWRYQCLRIMDEELCCSDEHITNEEMRRRIYKKAAELGIETKEISDSSFKQLYVILSDLINVEHRQGRRKLYNTKSVYEGGREGHLYQVMNGRQRLSAFAIDISVEEAHILRKEIGILRVKYFNDDRKYFSIRFPVITIIGDMEALAHEELDIKDKINKLYSTDLVTVNYKPVEMEHIKERTKEYIERRIPIAVDNGDSWILFRPVFIKEEGEKWVLIAKNIDTGSLRLFSPSELKDIFESKYEDFNIEWPEEKESFNVVGISPLLDGWPYDITLEVTKEGTAYIQAPGSLFETFKPKIEKKRDEYFYKDCNSYLVTFMAYVNADLLEQFFTLDRNARLIGIDPPEVMDLYRSYFSKRMNGKEWCPLNERGKVKVLKMPKNKANEE